jgi:hypothetical protein
MGICAGIWAYARGSEEEEEAGEGRGGRKSCSRSVATDYADGVLRQSLYEYEYGLTLDMTNIPSRRVTQVVWPPYK